MTCCWLYLIAHKYERDFFAIFYSQNVIMEGSNLHKAGQVSYRIYTQEAITCKCI